MRQLFRVIDWFMRLPEALEDRVWLEMQAIEQEKQMPYITSVERIGFRRGRAEGRAEGLRQSIELLLEARFGEQGRALAPDLGRVTGEDALRSLLQQVSKAGSIDDVRALLARHESPPGESPAGG